MRILSRFYEHIGISLWSDTCISGANPCNMDLYLRFYYGAIIKNIEIREKEMIQVMNDLLCVYQPSGLFVYLLAIFFS